MLENEIIKINYDGDEPTVSARDLHEKLNIESNFTTWFKRMCEYGFYLGKDFFPKMEESTGGRPATDYDLTIRCAKEICMIQRTDIGRTIRNYFLDLEDAWNTPEQVLNDNKYSFVRMAVYDHFMPKFEDADEEYEPFELGGLRVEIKYVNDKYEVKSTIKDKENNLVDEYTKQFDDIFDDMEEWLKYLGININFGSDDVEEYLKERINYREIFIR